MLPAIIAPGALAHWYPGRRFNRPNRCYRYTVRVLDIRKKTARIEAQRMDGTRVRRFVKLERLMPGADYFDR